MLPCRFWVQKRQNQQPVGGRWCRTGETVSLCLGQRCQMGADAVGCGGSSPVTSLGALGIPGSMGLLNPGALPLRGKNSQTPFSTTRICSYAGILGRICKSLSFVLWACVWFGRRGGQGSVPHMWRLPDVLAGVRLSAGSSGRGGGWRADGREITPPRHSDKDDPALPLIKRLILEFEIGI